MRSSRSDCGPSDIDRDRAGECENHTSSALSLLVWLSPSGQHCRSEVQILRLVADQLTNPEIASRLGLTEKTVRNNVSAIFTKLRVATRAQAIVAAREAGMHLP